MEDLAHYLMTDDFWHAAVAGWMWWAWNPNSIDTGGIVSCTWLHVPKIARVQTFTLMPFLYEYLV